MRPEPLAKHQIVCILNCTAGSDAARGAQQKLTSLFSQHDSRVKILPAETGSEITSLANQALKMAHR